MHDADGPIGFATCKNFPSWDENNDCGNGPPAGATNTVIEISNQNLGPPTEAEDVTIANKNCNWYYSSCMKALLSN